MEHSILLRETRSVAELTDLCVGAVVNGEVDPITLYINLSRMEQAIKAFKDNTEVRDITLAELSKYGKNERRFGDCTLEECESGVRYDFTQCGDGELAKMYDMRKALDADIKEREAMLKRLPVSGMADVESGAIMYPPTKSSKTTLRITFQKQ